MQKERTLLFWDEFYIQQQKQKQDDEDDHSKHDTNKNNNKEWIIQPTCQSLLETIYTHCLSRLLSSLSSLLDGDESSSINSSTSTKTRVVLQIDILEIGCGNSCFSIILWEYLLRKVRDRLLAFFVEKRDHQQQYNYYPPPIAIDIHVTATDVSSICIEQNQQRDEQRIQSIGNDLFVAKNNNDTSDQNVMMQKDDTSCAVETSTAAILNGSFQYQTFNILDTTTITGTAALLGNKCYDLILDKGCLDTFLFRSDSTNCDAYPPVLKILLNNIHSLLLSDNNNVDSCRDDNSNDNTHRKTDHHGMYVILTPRKKIKAVRDYQGFSNVKRIDLNCDVSDVGDLDTTKHTNNAAAVYMYICKKNDSYQIGNDEPFRQHLSSSSLQPSHHEDEEQCEKCNISFYQFRNGEVLSGRGAKYWNRRWVGHRHHCKGSASSSSS